MKKNFIIACMMLLVGCTSEQTKEETPSTTSTNASSPNLAYPYPVIFSDFKLDDQKNTETVMNIWKYWDEGNIDEQKKYYADTLEGHAWDGFYARASDDSFAVIAKQYRSSYSLIKSSVNGVMSFTVINKITGQTENWAGIWGKRILTDTRGKVDSIWLHEGWRFNKDGKAEALFQFAAKISTQ